MSDYQGRQVDEQPHGCTPSLFLLSINNERHEEIDYVNVTCIKVNRHDVNEVTLLCKRVKNRRQ